MKIKRTGLVILLGLLVMGSALIINNIAFTQSNLMIEQIGMGKIYWEDAAIKVVGMGAPSPGVSPAQASILARRAAIADAYRNLTEIVYGVRVDAETIVKNFVTESDVIKIKVGGVIKGAQIVREKPMPDGSYEVIMQLPLYGETSVAQVILPPAKEEQEKRLKEQKIEIPVLPPLPPPGVKEEKVEVTTYTGLIIDAREVKAKPAMSPKVIAENGDMVYGLVQVNPDVAVEKGIVGYAKSLDKAKQSWRAGDRPLIIKATGTAGPFNADVLISTKDAQKVMTANEKAGFLQNLRVTIVS